MKLSPKTIAVLENFQAINPAIVIEPGNILRTVSIPGTIFGAAKVEETFPRKFAIYELPKFLGILSLDKESDIEFLENYMIIKQGSTKIKYTYCEPSLIEVPPEGEIDINADLTFKLSMDDLTKVLKAMGVLKYSEVAITGKDGALSFSTIASKDPDNAISYSVRLGDTDQTFSYVIGSEILRIVKTDYTVRIDAEGLSHFKGQDIEYGIALKDKS